MRCFNKKAVHQQHLQEEVKWLQQMLAKEQQSKQAVLGQLQDERAKCALLELEILHAAQAAQEMGESLCLFFNPCYQQSEQQALQQGQGQYSSEGVLHVEGDEPPCARTLFQQRQQKQSKQQQQQQQQGEDDGLQVAQLFGTDLLDEPYPTQQQQPQQRQARQNSLDLPPGQMMQEGHGPYSAAATAAAAAAAAESKQDDLPSDPDTVAHDQTPTKLRESAVLLASTDHWPTNSEGRLHSPRRSLKVSSPGRKSSPRRLARNSPGRSLRVSSSSPLKPPAAPAAAAAGGGAGGSMMLGTDSSTDQQQLATCASQEKDVTCGPDAPHTADAAAPADMSAAGAHLLAAAAVPSTGGTNPAHPRGNSNRTTFSAAAAAAAAVQQSLSAASAAIAAAEALRGQSRVSTARSTPGDMQGSILAPAAAVAAATATTKRPLPSSTPAPAESIGNPLQLLPTTAVDATATEAAVEGSSLPVTHSKPRFTISQAGSGFDSKSSSSSDSACGEPSHKLPASIVAQPLEPDHDTAHSGSPGKAATSRVAVVVGASTNTTPQQQQQEEEEGADGVTDGSAAAAAAVSTVGADLWQPGELRSQPVSVLVSSLARKSRNSSRSGGGGKGSAAASVAKSGLNGRKQTTSSSSSASSTAHGPDKVVSAAAAVHSTLGPQQRQELLEVPHGDGAAASPPAGHPGTAAGPVAQTAAAGQPAAGVPAAAADSTASAVGAVEPAASSATTQDAAAAAGSAVAPVAEPDGSNAHSEAVAAAAAGGNMTGVPVRKSTHRKPPLAPLPVSRDQRQAANGPGLRGSTRQAHGSSASASAAAAAGGGGGGGDATDMQTQLVARAYNSQQQTLPLPPSRLQQQQQHQQNMRSVTAGGAAGAHSPLKSAVAVIVGPMHAAAFGPALAQQQTSANNSSRSGTKADVVRAKAGTRMQQTDKPSPAAAAEPDAADADDKYAQMPPVGQLPKSSMSSPKTALGGVGWCQKQKQPQQQQQRQLAPQRRYSSSRAAACERQPLLPHSHNTLRKTATHAAAAAAVHTAIPQRFSHPGTATSAGAALAAADLGRCYQAVCAPADCAPSSCLSPLHWHQSNLGSSRSDFHQAMMLAACSNPSSVMRQQLAFDQQDSKTWGRSTGRYLGSRGGTSSRGFMSGKGSRAAGSKARKGWMALF